MFLRLMTMATSALAQAQEAAPAMPGAAPKGPSLFEMLVMPVGFLVIMYLFILKPQQKKARDQADLVTNLKPGDEVVTSGGIIGKVRSVAESFVTIEVSQNTSLKVLKTAVQSLTKAPGGKDVPAKA